MLFRSSLVALPFAAAPIWAATDSLSGLEKAAARPAEGIMDNSFLIEEAYNQGPGVVQHILNVVHTSSRLAGPDERALYASNHPGDAQTVIGIAVPIGITSDAPDYGVFLYAPFEHFFFRPRGSGLAK